MHLLPFHYRPTLFLLHFVPFPHDMSAVDHQQVSSRGRVRNKFFLIKNIWDERDPSESLINESM